MIKYISPTSLRMFYQDRTEFFLHYAVRDRMPQNQAMSVGASFDAYVKSYIAERLGITGFEFEQLFETQVEEPNRVWAREAGAICFKTYKDSGALADLMGEISVARHTPRMESRVEGHVGEVPMMGKPDLYFITKEGEHAIWDFKVNGYCSASGRSPTKGYINCRGSWGRNGVHKDAQVMRIGGLLVNITCGLEELDTSWAEQLCIYAWCLGEEIGGKFIVGIEQLACSSRGIRVASFRNRVSLAFQAELRNRIVRMWTLLGRGHIFDDLTREESDLRCKALRESESGGWIREAARS